MFSYNYFIKLFLYLGPNGQTRLVTTSKSIVNDTNATNQNSLNLPSTNSPIISKQKHFNFNFKY